MALKFAKTKIKKQAERKQLYSFIIAKNAICNEKKDSGIMGEMLHVSYALDPLFCKGDNFSKNLDNIKKRYLRYIATLKKNINHNLDSSFKRLNDISDRWKEMEKSQDSNQSGTSITRNDIKICENKIKMAYGNFYKLIEINQPTSRIQSLKNKISPKKIPTDALQNDLDEAYKELRDKIPQIEVMEAMLKEWFEMKCLSLSFVELVTRLNTFKVNKKYKIAKVLAYILASFSVTCAAICVLHLHILSALVWTLLLAFSLRLVSNVKEKEKSELNIDIKDKNLKSATRGTIL